MSLGIRYILLAGLFFGMINVLVKYYSHIPAIEVVFFRSLVSLLISYFIVKKNKEKVFNDYSSLLFLRGLFGAIALILYFTTIQNIPLGSAVTLLYLAPIFTVILAGFIVKEKANLMQWPFFIISFSGAMIIKSFDPRVEIKYFFMGVTAAFFAGLAYNMIRLLKEKVSANLVILYFPLVTIPLCIPFLIKQWITPSFKDTVGLILLGLITQVAQIYMTKAYQHSKASEISHFNYLTTIYALIAGFLFFNEQIKISSVMGISLIVFGVYFSTKFSKKPT